MEKLKLSKGKMERNFFEGGITFACGRIAPGPPRTPSMHRWAPPFEKDFLRIFIPLFYTLLLFYVTPRECLQQLSDSFHSGPSISSVPTHSHPPKLTVFKSCDALLRNSQGALLGPVI
jgi:hypothetical protein